jgi:SNF2 family DNA or RNA helicase
MKPSPFLKTEFEDESGVHEIRVRDYQVRGIMNMLMVPKTILGDGTGLGKTLSILSMIGYVWMKEPEYVPIIFTKKSALFQWAAEVRKFMQGMRAVVVDGEPHERDAIYADFFLGPEAEEKRLLVMTYDTMFRDMAETVVRDRSEKPSKQARARLKEAKEGVKAVEARKAAVTEALNARFSGRGDAVSEYVRACLAPADKGARLPPEPPGWDQGDREVMRAAMDVKGGIPAAKAELEAAKNEAEPPKVVDGILRHADAMMGRFPGKKLMLVMDEIHTLKNHSGKMHAAAKKLSLRCERTYGMTATPVKNRLMEFFALFQLIEPGLFPRVTRFQDEFCVTKLQSIGGGRKVPVIVGYKNLDRFVERVEPYYLARQKHEVASELPSLVTRELTCTLSDMEEELYDLAEAGALQKSEEADASSADILSSMVLIQEACNSPELISDEDGNAYQGRSTKVDTILDLLENELDGVKTIIFSRFERMVSIAERELTARGIKCVRITGKEAKASEREKAKNQFQSKTSGIDVILITTAGSESINLQAAEHIIFIDSPWSWGDYVQLIGRGIRIGSDHAMFLATHLVARKRNGAKTIDDHVNKKLREKQALADKVAGESLKGGLEFQESAEAMDIFAEIRKSVAAGDKAATAAGRARAAAVAKVGRAKPAGRKSPVQAAAPPERTFAAGWDFSDI